MKISVATIANQGDLEKEVVTLQVNEDCDLGNYILTDATCTRDDRLEKPFRNTFWFEPTEVKKGDYVLVHSRVGEVTHHSNQLGSTTHEFFWNVQEPVWHETEDAVLLFEVAAHEMKKTRSFTSFV